MTKTYTFDVGKKKPAAEWARPGKPESSAHVRIELDLDRALELAQMIIQHARNRGGVFSYVLLGELREEPEE